MTKEMLERLRDLSYTAGQQNTRGRQESELLLLKETTEIIEALLRAAAEPPVQQVGKLAWNDNPLNHALNCPCLSCKSDPETQARLRDLMAAQRLSEQAPATQQPAIVQGADFVLAPKSDHACEPNEMDGNVCMICGRAMKSNP